ncbi:MAG: fructose-6-phosphate aldolase [Clostridiales bacterium]|jgi:TalC/MipB family fructose-6-phosphate aldolase|nr:fructose-6-phosphate aldolase [Clostridiales bacterium]
MEFLFDTINIPDIAHYGKCFPYTGVTSNPSIIKAEGKIDFFQHFREIRKLITIDRSLHIQVISQDCNGILKEADTILNKVDEKVFIKVPVTEEGLKAMQSLKKEGIGVTATGIYTAIQGFMAIGIGADYIAPYYNRMENQNIDPVEVISSFAQVIKSQEWPTKIVTASFKNIAQVNKALIAGAQAVTVQPSLLHEVFGMAAIQKAVDGFTADWTAIFGDKKIWEL